MQHGLQYVAAKNDHVADHIMKLCSAIQSIEM